MDDNRFRFGVAACLGMDDVLAITTTDVYCWKSTICDCSRFLIGKL